MKMITKEDLEKKKQEEQEDDKDFEELLEKAKELNEKPEPRPSIRYGR